MLQPPHARRRPAQPCRDLRRRQSHQMTEHENLALIVRQRRERVPQREGPQLRRLTVNRLALELAAVLAQHRAAAADMLNRDVPRDTEQPRVEQALPLPELRNDDHQLREHVLSHVLSLMLIPDDAAHVAVHAVRVPDVKEPDRFAVAALRTANSVRDETPARRVVIPTRAATEHHAASRAIAWRVSWTCCCCTPSARAT